MPSHQTPAVQSVGLGPDPGRGLIPGFSVSPVATLCTCIFPFPHLKRRISLFGFGLFGFLHLASAFVFSHFHRDDDGAQVALTLV